MEDECIFCKIVKGELPAEKIYEDNYCIVVPDKFPAMKGQCLLIAKKHEDYVFDLDDENYKGIFLAAKKVVKAMDKALSTTKTCLLVEGFEVPHSHVKFFPTYGEGLNIHGGSEASDEELKELAAKIRENLD